MVKVTRQNDRLSDGKSQQTEEILQKMKEASIEETAAKLAASHGFAYVDLSLFPIEEEEVALIPEEDARRLGFILLQKRSLQALFAIADPENQEALTYITDFSEKRGWEHELYVVSRPALERAWETYSKRAIIDNLDLVRVSLQGEDLEQFEKDFGELISLKENRPTTTSHSMEVILAGAKKLGASDIHLEPEELSVRLRYRVDGVLQNVGSLTPAIYHQLLSRVKMIGKMRLNVRDKAQDGHFFITLANKRIDVRVNIIPGKYGESVNMRLLSGDDVIVDINSLGLRGLAREEVLRQIEKPHGLVLNTGPTGSGKTTTLYTLLNNINRPGTKIITVEDPIEYSLPGIVQTEVSKDKTYTFASALRAIVRQDPDVILIGEIRDDETADIAVNAALTGHLVLSTLHANSAPGAIPRFMELGVKPSILTASINILIAQRLVRKLCDTCKQSYEPAKETLDFIVRLITVISPKAKIAIPKDIGKLWKAVGCADCHFTGFKGRIGIFEVFTMTPEIVTIIEDLGTEEEIFRAALENGMVTMTQDGILKTLDGTTTIEEVSRVTDQSDMLKSIYLNLMSSDLSHASFIPADLFSKTLESISSFQEFETYSLTADSKLRLQIIFAAAIGLHAGDIHVEPSDKDFAIRFRIDGMLQTIARFPLNEYPSFIGEIKNLVGLKTSQRAGITDKRFSITLEKPIDSAPNGQVDVRLSLIPGGFGETVVMRLLNQSASKLNLDTLALRKQNLDRILTAAGNPNGIILNTGPTGSGKTTTLYSTLTLLNKPESKIITVEDPIEYQMPGVLQTQVNEAEGYTFSTALRALLRQNPDILMIGEIRDDETAQIAIQAATTGHLVLSTLHTNSAAGAISRLMKMGVSGDDIANAGGLLIAQRLVRKLCDQCKHSRVPTDTERATIKKALTTLSPQITDTPKDITEIWGKVGCSSCNGTGYSGQIVLSETIPLDNDIKDLIARGALTHELEEKAVENGMITIAQDGILSVIEGRTTLEEVERVTDV
jgi:type IV pilus assembly protein PilB